jgi:predicted DNA-binding transcriptional regulator
MRNNYEERILSFLSQSNMPIDVEKIRKSCKIANWNTAAKHCLELHSQGLIQGEKTTKGWVFWIYQETHLSPWEEAIGTLDKVENSETHTIALLTCTYKKQIAIPLPKDQPETKKLQELLGKKIAILKTDNPDKPLAIRAFTETPDAKNIHCWNLWLRRSLLCFALKGYALKFSLWYLGLRLRWWF